MQTMPRRASSVFGHLHKKQHYFGSDPQGKGLCRKFKFVDTIRTGEEVIPIGFIPIDVNLHLMAYSFALPFKDPQNFVSLALYGALLKCP